MADFQETVLEKLDIQGEVLTRLDVRMDGMVEKVNGHHKTLYGGQGDGGLCQSVTLLKERQSAWNKGLTFLISAAIGLAAWAKFWKD